MDCLPATVLGAVSVDEECAMDFEKVRWSGTVTVLSWEDAPHYWHV